MRMANSSSKSPGRTPPFILVALVLLVVILGYNYWMLSSSNRNLSEMNDKLAEQSKDSKEKRLIADKNNEVAREELHVSQSSLEQSKKSLEQARKELEDLRNDANVKAEEFKKYKDDISKCDKELKTEKETVGKLQGEKGKLEQDLKAEKEKKPQECNADSCVSPMQSVVVAASQLVGTDAMKKALQDNKLDADKLMQGVHKIDAPAVESQGQ